MRAKLRNRTYAVQGRCEQNFSSDRRLKMIGYCIWQSVLALGFRTEARRLGGPGVATMNQHAKRHNRFASCAMLYLVALASILVRAHDLDTLRLPNHHVRLPATHVQVIINSYSTCIGCRLLL